MSEGKSCFKPEPAGCNVTNGRLSCSVALNPLVWLLWMLDFLVWLIWMIPIGTIIAIVRMAGKAPPGKLYGDAWRCNYNAETELVTCPSKGMATAWDCFEASFKKFASNKCMGTRTYLGEHRKEEGHKIVKKIFGDTTWQTYGEVHQRALNFGQGLRALGMEPSPSKSKAEFEASSAPDTLLLWEDTCADWMTCAAAAFSQTLVVATSYATLGIDGVIESINQCECPVVVCNRSQVKKLVEARAQLEDPSRLSTIIYTNLYAGGGKAHGEPWKDGGKLDMGDVVLKPEPLKPLEMELPEGLKIMEFNEVVELGKNTPCEQVKPTADAMAVVMYTSGSTGKPKGVCIAHKNLCASVGGMARNFSAWGKEGAETYIAYLPAAHILELVAEIAMISFGSTIGAALPLCRLLSLFHSHIGADCARGAGSHHPWLAGYADPRSIASSGACRAYAGKDGPTINFLPCPEAPWEQAPGAVQEFKPTCMAAVPKIWDIFKKTVEEKVAGGSAVTRVIFEAAFAACSNASTWRFCPLLGLIFKKVGAVTGGNIKAGISGGGPLASDVQNFCRICFGFPLVQGYALTETCCAGSVQLTSDSEDGIVGAPLASVEIKLEDCPDIQDRAGNGYLTTDTKHWDGMACAGRGEVLIKGPSVSLGYYAKGDQAESLIKKTTEEFGDAAPNQTEHHWFHTGDIGLFTPDGRLKLIDRKKNLVKLKGGEYVAIEAMEAVYGTSIYVDAKAGGIMCHGDGDMDKPVALLLGNIPNIVNWAKENGITEEDPDALCKNEKVIEMVLKDLVKIGKASDSVAKNEILCAIHIIPGTGPAVFPGNETSPWTPENGFLTASNKIDRNAIKHGKTMGDATSDSFAGVLQPLRLKAGADAASVV